MPSSKSNRALLRKRTFRVFKGKLTEVAQVRMGSDARRELVSHPMHYGGDTPHEVIKCLEAWGLEFDALLWNAAKYIARAAKKGDSITDLKKAAFYLDRRIVQLQSANAGKPQAANESPAERQPQRKSR